MAKKPKLVKEFSFGGARFGATSPPLKSLTSNTAKLNLTVSFEEALKLHLAIGECVRKLNTYKRSTTEGKRKAMNLMIHMDAHRVTVNETMRTEKPEEVG